MDAFAPVKDEASRRHPEDRDDPDDAAADSDIDSNASKSADDLNSDDDNFEIPGTGPNDDMPVFKSSTQLSGSYQTGVKGVIADAKSFESARRRTHIQQKRQSNYTDFPDYAPLSDLDARIPPNPDGPSSGEEGNEGFVQTWRKNRLAELRTGIATVRKQSPSKRKYGRVETVDAAGYLDAVERVSSETVVVVTIYNDESDESIFVEDCLNTLSRRYVTTRFVKLHHLEAEMDAAAVPAMLAYKGGELFANIMRIVDEIPPGRNLSTDSLELVLRRANVLHKD